MLPSWCGWGGANSNNNSGLDCGRAQGRFALVRVGDSYLVIPKAVISLSVEAKNIDIGRFLGYVCHIAKVRVRVSFGWVSLFAQKFVFFDLFVRMRI